jgi:hypothetical protein
MYRELAFKEYGAIPELPGAKELGESSIALLVHPTLSTEHITVAAEVLKDTLRRAVR